MCMYASLNGQHLQSKACRYLHRGSQANPSCDATCHQQYKVKLTQHKVITAWISSCAMAAWQATVVLSLRLSDAAAYTCPNPGQGGMLQ